MKTIMTGIALAALIAGSPALAGGKWQQLAQADQQPGQMQEMQASPTCPAGETCPSDATAPDAMAPDATGPDTTGSLPAQPDESAATQGDKSQDLTAQTADSGGKFITEQSDDAILATELIGKTVYDAGDESLGDVNDIVWTDDGKIEGVIVGVGGFLGIGEKNVAVNYDAINVTTDENGNKKLVLDATSDELAAAPEFVTSAQKLAELQAQQPPTVDQGPGAVVPIPQPEPAPAQ